MDFKLKDLGKIKKADIKLDGITVICGDNNTGKSTIGKSLFSFYNALYDYKTKISMQKDSRFKNFILSNINSMDVPVRLLDNDSTMSFITSQADFCHSHNHMRHYKEKRRQSLLLPMMSITQCLC
ncbi:MAG: AAA family ATPase [Ruminococcus callidus]